MSRIGDVFCHWLEQLSHRCAKARGVVRETDPVILPQKFRDAYHDLTNSLQRSIAQNKQLQRDAERYGDTAQHALDDLVEGMSKLGGARK